MPVYVFKMKLTDEDVFDVVPIEDVVDYFGKDLLGHFSLQDIIDCNGTSFILEAIGKQDILDWLGTEAMVSWLEKNTVNVLRDDKQEELPVLTPEE